MSTLKELLKDVPVEWKALGKITRVLRGRRLTKNQLSTEGYPVYHGGLEPLGYYDSFNRPSNSVMIINVGASAGNVGISPTDFWSSDGCYCLQQIENIYSKYLFYFLLSQELYLKSKVRYAGIPTLDAAIIDNVQFPIPFPNDPQKSLAIQQEIVRVLDNLSEQNKALTSALANEIEQRKKQYAYYREELFRFEEKEVEWRTFGDLGEIIRGNGLQKSDFTESGVGCIHYGQIYTYYGTSTVKTKSFVSPELALKLKKVSKGDLIITNTSENVEDVCKAVAWLGEDEIVTGGHACILKHKQNPKYIAYYTQISEFYKDKRKFAKGTKVMDVSAKDLAKIKIPILPIQEQERIVRLLDQYDVTTKNIIAELEKEIELRNKQYEYYRNQLLMFNG